MSRKTSKNGTVSRRSALQTVGVFVAGAAATAHWKRSYAQTVKEVRVWTTQVAPAQLEGNEYYKKTFEEAHPGIKLTWETITDEDGWPKLIAAQAGGNPPELVQNLTIAWNATAFLSGWLEPVDEVVEKVGKNDWSPALDAYFKDPKSGVYFGVPIGGNAFATMWYRKDLFEKAGVQPPQDWAETVQVFKKLKAGGIIGHPLPYAKGGMTDVTTWGLINKAGGSTVVPDSSAKSGIRANLDTQATIDALEYLKEIREYAPVGATSYSFSQSLSAFIGGQTATSWYTGRALMNISTDNPKILDDVKGIPWPSKDRTKPWFQGGYHAHWLMKNSKNVKEAKLVAAWHYRPDVYIKFLHGAPTHLLTILKSVADNPKYYDHPLMQKKKDEIKMMLAQIDAGWERVIERKGYPINFKAGEVFGKAVYSEMCQRAVINNENPKAVAKWGHDEVQKILNA